MNTVSIVAAVFVLSCAAVLGEKLTAIASVRTDRYTGQLNFDDYGKGEVHVLGQFNDYPFNIGTAALMLMLKGAKGDLCTLQFNYGKADCVIQNKALSALMNHNVTFDGVTSGKVHNYEQAFASPSARVH